MDDEAEEDNDDEEEQGDSTLGGFVVPDDEECVLMLYDVAPITSFHNRDEVDWSDSPTPGARTHRRADASNESSVTFPFYMQPLA